MIYSSAELFKMKVFDEALHKENIKLVVIKGDAISLIDATAVLVSNNKILDLEKKT